VTSVKARKWLGEVADPESLLQLVRGTASERKLRLFAVACCRCIWPLLPGGPVRAAVEVAERFAEGQATPEELRAARLIARREEVVVGGKVTWDAALTAAKRTAWEVLVLAQDTAYVADGSPDIHGWENTTWDDLSRRLCDLIRDLFNPLQPVTLDPTWLTWHAGTIPNLARTIYAEQAFDRLPILGDALEDAGCSEAHLLDHCRNGGEHVRGCWVIDLLLGKT
jgi:hypothetical protein